MILTILSQWKSVANVAQLALLRGAYNLLQVFNILFARFKNIAVGRCCAILKLWVKNKKKVINSLIHVVRWHLQLQSSQTVIECARVVMIRRETVSIHDL